MLIQVNDEIGSLHGTEDIDIYFNCFVFFLANSSYYKYISHIEDAHYVLFCEGSNEDTPIEEFSILPLISRRYLGKELRLID